MIQQQVHSEILQIIIISQFPCTAVEKCGISSHGDNIFCTNPKMRPQYVRKAFDGCVTISPLLMYYQGSKALVYGEILSTRSTYRIHIFLRCNPCDKHEPPGDTILVKTQQSKHKSSVDTLNFIYDNTCLCVYGRVRCCDTFYVFLCALICICV